MQEFTRRTVLVTVAHPDDETFGCGSLIAHLAARGTRVVVACATRGEAGEDALGRDLPPAALGAVRAEELHAAAAILGAADVDLLDFADSGWDGPCPPGALADAGADLVRAVEELLARHRPDVVITLDPTGSDGHRDHAAIGAATTRAVEAGGAATALYHWCLPRSLMRRWAAAIAGTDPASVYLDVELGRPDEEITTVLSTDDVLEVVDRAMRAHASQRSPFHGTSDELRRAFVTQEHMVRVRPVWTGAPLETTLAGLNGPV